MNSLGIDEDALDRGPQAEQGGIMGTIEIPNRNRVASIDVDAQRTFTPLCPNELPVPEGDRIVAELNAQAEFASLRIGSKDAHPDNAVWRTDDPSRIGAALAGEPNAPEQWVAHALVGSEGFELLPGLPPVSDYGMFVYKGAERDLHPYGACYHDVAETVSTGLIETLKARGITTALVGGLATDYCVKATVLQLRRAGIDVVLNRAATRGIAPESVEEALALMREAGTRFANNTASLRAAAS
jgi:nicotinamidase/pyrazinamidase